MAIAERGALSVEEAAKYLGLSKSKTWVLVSSGQIPSWHIGRNRRVSVERLQQWIREQEAAQRDAA